MFTVYTRIWEDPTRRPYSAPPKIMRGDELVRASLTHLSGTVAYTCAKLTAQEITYQSTVSNRDITITGDRHFMLPIAKVAMCYVAALSWDPKEWPDGAHDFYKIHDDQAAFYDFASQLGAYRGFSLGAACWLWAAKVNRRNLTDNFFTKLSLDEVVATVRRSFKWPG